MLQIDKNVWGYLFADSASSNRQPPTPVWLAMKWRMCCGHDDRTKRLEDMTTLLGRPIKSFYELTDLERLTLKDYLRVYEPTTTRVEDHAGTDAGGQVHLGH